MRRREVAEAERLRVECELRPRGAREADRDHGLERAWARRLAGATLTRGSDQIELLADGGYRAVFAQVEERGRWWLSSCVGRTSLRLEPVDGQPYGFILSRTAAGVALNGEPYES